MSTPPEISWQVVRDGNADALSLFMRHYTCRNPALKLRGGNRSRFVGPGQQLVLITPGKDALFVWRTEKYRKDTQTGINCAVFRNESAIRSSALIQAAERIAWERRPGLRLFTFVNPRKVRSSNPGCCFKRAGWSPAGTTKKRRLLVFEKFPPKNTIPSIQTPEQNAL